MKQQLITVENADRRNVNSLSLQPVKSLKHCLFNRGLEMTPWLKTHLILSQPIHGATSGHKKALLTWRTLTY